jgi:P4 family phage/plasmid primase-like protien
MSKISNSEIKKYIKQNLVVFSINIEQKYNDKLKKWKKKVDFPFNWTEFTLKSKCYNKENNGVALRTGKINNILVIDIDNIEHWNNLLKEQNQTEPNTVKSLSGSGGVHLYFKYNDELENITSKDHCFGSDYDIDIKTNGGCIICPPSKYFNKNLNKEVEYIWEKSIFDHELMELPNWIKSLLLKKHNIKKKNNSNLETKNNIKIEEINDECEIAELDVINKMKFCEHDIEILLDMLDVSRCNNYNDWINVGLCLYNINEKNLELWKKWSHNSDKYEEGSCEVKWKSFNKKKDGLTIGSLMLWCKEDDKDRYDMFLKKHKFKEMIISKFPHHNLELDETIVISDTCNYTPLHNEKCIIKGDYHKDLSKTMYVEMIKDLITIRCKHPECFGKIFPCPHVQLTKQEMNIAFNNSNFNITINNNCTDDYVEFQKVNIFEDEKLNELIYNGLDGEDYSLAEIIYYLHKTEFNFGEDDKWYIYDNHRWKITEEKNHKLRNMIQQLKEYYIKLLNHYKECDCDKNKLKKLKDIIKSFNDTGTKNNIMTELMEIYAEYNNPKRDFTKKLDANKYLIGFNNGVYDLQKFEFREGKPDDNITLSVGYDYNDKHTEKYHELLKFLHDIQPKNEDYEFMITYLSIGLIGNILELFTILTGCGRNGKSKLVELLKLTLGDYFGSVQSQLFTRPRPDANSPDPGLLSLAKKRVVIASEPEKNSKLNSGFIKFITGRDSTTLRNCHSNNMVDFSPQFLTFLICNDIPECDDIDNAFSKRLRCIHFPTEFVVDPKAENQKKIDTSINENFDFWKMDFMLLLIEYYKKYNQTKVLSVTENILKWTNQYKEDTDMYLQFLNECTEHSDIHIRTSDIYDQFKNWFKINNPATKIPSNREFLANIKKYKVVEYVKIDKCSLYGIKNLKIKEDI